MPVFKLPDLGEGLPDAIIREWYVKVGEPVTVDQPIAAMETAKALVDVPSPYTGMVEKLFGQPGDTIETGQPLIGYSGVAGVEENSESAQPEDAGTVVGALERSNTILKESAIGVKPPSPNAPLKATPAVRSLAKKLGVNLEELQPQGDRITIEDVQRAATATTARAPTLEMQSLSPVRRAMLMTMVKAHQSVVPVTLSDDADLHAWNADQDTTIRLIRAIQVACEQEPMLNAIFDEQAMQYRLNTAIHLGIAVDTKQGLYVPVLKDIAKKTDAELRQQLNQFKEQAKNSSLPAADLHGSTITLSNFGTLAGRYANPIIIPPTVAIIGVGGIRDQVVAFAEKIAIHRLMPLSLTIDHRWITGGEAARFLQVMLEALSQPAPP